MIKQGRLDQDRLALDKEKQTLELAQKKKMNDLDLISRASADIKDQADYEKRLGFLSNQGVDVSQMPKAFDPQLVNTYRMSALSTLEQLGQGNKDRDFQYGKEKDAKLFAYNQQKDQQEFGLQKQRFNFDQTDKNRNYDLALAKEGLSREMFQSEDEYKRAKLKQGEEALALRSKDAEALEKYRQARMAQGGKSGATGSDRTVPGLGVALTAQDASQMKDAAGMKQKFDRQIGELIKLREDYGNEAFNQDAVARGEQLSKDLLLTYKNLSKLGVLSKSDEAIINEIIPSSPLTMDGWGIRDTFNMVTGQDPKLTKLKGFQKDINEDFANNVASRIQGGDQIAQQMRGEFNQNQGTEDSGFIKEAQASGATFDNLLKSAPQMQGQDLDAFKWASQNSQDPRAQGILQNLNNKYGGR
jgi:hypothetical protein